MILVLCPTHRELIADVRARMWLGDPHRVWRAAQSTMVDASTGQSWYFVNTSVEENQQKLRGQVFEAVEGDIPDTWRDIVLSRVRKEASK